MISSEQNYKYWAFISYARSDKEIAKKIHQDLEKYRTPKSLIEESRIVLPKHFCPVFMDLKDLSTTDANYRDGLENALQNSKHLIVLCSKSSARKESVCHWEIAEFLKTHSPDAIMPIALEGVDDAVIPEELHEIKNSRNIILWDPAGQKTGENKNEILKLAAFLLGVPTEDLYDRHKQEKALRKRKSFIVFTVFLILLTCFSSALALQAYRRSQSEYQRAEFEKKVFPYSLVYAYVNNFLYPITKADTFKKTIFILAMPKDYSELDNHEKKKRDHFSMDAVALGWQMERVNLNVPNRPRSLNVEKMFHANMPFDQDNVYADMVTTVSAVKSVVDYLTKPGNPYYNSSQKDEITMAYIEEFKQSLLNLDVIKREINAGNLKIYFAADATDLKKIMQEIESSLQTEQNSFQKKMD